jgi:hypothetical protein
MAWYRVDLTQVQHGQWRTYVRELELFGHGSSKAVAEDTTVALIVEITGDVAPQIVWNEC